MAIIKNITAYFSKIFASTVKTTNNNGTVRMIKMSCFSYVFSVDDKDEEYIFNQPIITNVT
jgi:hypothetical protein